MVPIIIGLLVVGFIVYDYLAHPDIAYAPDPDIDVSALPPSDLPDNDAAICAPCPYAERGQWGTALFMGAIEITPMDEIPGVSTAVRKALKEGGEEAAEELAEEGVEAGITVLGHYPECAKKAEELGGRFFDIPTDIWNKMTDAERWAANKKFLDRAIARGDEFILATELNPDRLGSFFAKELDYLKSLGYEIVDNRLVKPK